MVRLLILRLFETFFRHRWLYMLPIALMLVAAGIYIFAIPPEHISSGTILVEKETLLASLTSDAASTTMWRTPATVTVGEIKELLSTKAFVRSAIQRTELEPQMAGGQQQIDETLNEFRKSIIVYELGDKLVEIRATHENPQIAQQIVSATMESYIQWQINKGYQESVVAQSFFANLIKPYQEDLQNARANMQAYLESYPEPKEGKRPPQEQMEIEQLQAEINRAEELVINAMKNEESARLALTKSESVARQTYAVIDTPEVPEARISLRKLAITLALFLGVGLFLSIAAIVLGTLFDRTLRFPLDARHALSLPVLAMVPSATPRPATPPLDTRQHNPETDRERTAGLQPLA